MLPIKGLHKTSLIDYPPYTSSVVFVGGCNFRCGYCQNAELVINHKEIASYDEKYVCDFLRKKSKWLDALVITGGEPTLYIELVDFVREVKNLGLKIKLDTNGTNPDLIWDMLDEGLLDYVAMDIKAPIDKYEKVTVFPVEIEKIKRTITLIKNSKNLDYEFRTTVLPELLTMEDLEKIGNWINGAKRFVIQPFRNSKNLLDKRFETKKGYEIKELYELKEIMKPYVDEVILRSEYIT